MIADLCLSLPVLGSYLSVFVYHSPETKEVEETVEVQISPGVYEKQKRKTTKRVHQTDVWFLVSGLQVNN
jgi:hypothetical protein